MTTMLKRSLAQVSDPRRAQGRRYDLPHVLLYSVLAVASGATSYRKIEQFMQTHWERLNEAFGSRWKRAPAYTGLRKILQGLRRASSYLSRQSSGHRPPIVACHRGADHLLAFRVEGDGLDVRPVACAA